MKSCAPRSSTDDSTPGSRLPATRDLASAYRLSRSTIVTAFEQLESEGYVEGRTGSGTYVSAKSCPTSSSSRTHVRRKSTSPSTNFPLRIQPATETISRRRLRPTRAFRANQPALNLFPTALWAQIAARRLRRVSTGMLSGGEALGYRPLREAVAYYLSTSRGVKCSAEQVLILSGAQEALIARREFS